MGSLPLHAQRQQQRMKRAGSGNKATDQSTLSSKDRRSKKNAPLICVYKTKHSVEELKSTSFEEDPRPTDFRVLAQRPLPAAPHLPDLPVHAHSHEQIARPRLRPTEELNENIEPDVTSRYNQIKTIENLFAGPLRRRSTSVPQPSA